MKSFLKFTCSFSFLVISAGVLYAQSEGMDDPVEQEGASSISRGNTPRGSAPGEPSSASPAKRPGNDAAGIRELMRSLEMQSGALNWRGTSFPLGDPNVVRSRFERYLNVPEATSDNDLKYNALLEEIDKRLVGRGGGSTDIRVGEAWRMLYLAAEYPIDNRLSETLADRIISYKQMAQKMSRLEWQTEILEKDKERAEVNLRSIGDRDRREFIDLMRGTKSENAVPPPDLEYLADPHRKKLEEVEKKIEENKQYGTLATANQKLEFQSMMLQFFVQRRFQHALLANTFYRYVFEAEENTIEGADSLRGQVFGDLDVKITTTTVDALAKEAISDVEEGVETVKYLLEQGEVHSASIRLMEAYYLGEHLPPIKTFPREQKRKILLYLRDLDSLATSLEVKNFDRAEEILQKITKYAVDFDHGRAATVIETSKRLSNLAVQRAKSAANLKDSGTAQAALEEAIALWPTNPNIAQFSDAMLEMTSLKDVAFSDFDRLIQQSDFRAIFNDRFRYAAALAADPSRNEEFLGIMKRMERIESALAQAEELARIKNAYGAWEVLERVYRSYPEDQELNRARGDYAVRAADFASSVSRAEDAMNSGDYVGAMFAYLEAKKLNPTSYFAEKGIKDAVDLLLESREERDMVLQGAE